MALFLWVACAALLAFTLAAAVVNTIASENRDDPPFGLIAPALTFVVGAALFAAATWMTSH